MAIKVTVDNGYREFEKRVGVLGPIALLWLDKILEKPLEPLMGAAGIFCSREINRLLAFIEENPEYHIVSLVGRGQVMVNHYIPYTNRWMLADGDDDPDLVHVTSVAELDRTWDALLDALPILRKYKLPSNS